MTRLILIFSVLMMASCGFEHALVVTDPFWDDFSSRSSSLYSFKKYSFLLKNGVWPHFRSYQDSLQNFPLWLNDQVAGEKYKSVFLTRPFADYSGQLDFKLPLVVLGGSVELSSSDSAQIISVNNRAFYEAGNYLKDQWTVEERVPVVILWKGSGFDSSYRELLEGWGDKEAILRDNTLILEESSSDPEGRISSFYSRFDFRSGKWCLFAAAEPVLGEILKAWPEKEDVAGILMTADHDFLPDNIQYLIVRDFLGILAAAGESFMDSSSEKNTAVDALFIKR